MILRRYEEFFNAKNYESFKEAVVNLAINNPDDCADLLLYVLHSDRCHIEGNPFEVLTNDDGRSRFWGRPLPVDFSQDDTFLMYLDFQICRDYPVRDSEIDEHLQDLEFLVKKGEMSPQGLNTYKEIQHYKAFLHDMAYFGWARFYKWEHAADKYEKFQRDASWNIEFQLYKEYIWHKEQEMRNGREDMVYQQYKRNLEERASELHKVYLNKYRVNQGEGINEGVKNFIKLCAETHVEQLPGRTQMIEQVLHQLYGHDGAEAIKHFLLQADMDTIEEFAVKMMNPEELARIASVDIVVRKVDDAEMKGNLGRYRIYTRENAGEETLLTFSYKNSMVYYLMFLIDRKNRTGRLKPVSLVRNRDALLTLYGKVYNVSKESVLKKLQELVRRQEGGRLRVGRLNETICDIRRHLEEAFKPYYESYFPYAMTADSHLAISPNRIHFEDEAGELLEFSFQD